MRVLALWPLVVALPLLGGCRIGFENRPSDASADVLASAPPHKLSCSDPPQFSIASGVLSALGAADTDTGYYLFAVDDPMDGSGDVRGFAYEFEGDQLVARHSSVPVFSNATGSVGAISIGDDLLVALPYGRPAQGTALIPLDHELAPGQAVLRDQWFSLDRAVARAGDGTLALLGQQQEAGEALIERVTATGDKIGTEHAAIAAGDEPHGIAIMPLPTGFLVTWMASAAGPKEARAEVLDTSFNLRLPATAMNLGVTGDGNDPRAAYAPEHDRYLFAWWFKTSQGDDVWISLRDGQFTERELIRVSTQGKFPKVVAGPDDFLVVWQDARTTSGLDAARVGFDGSVTPLPIVGGGGIQRGWDVVMRAGQPAVVWLEDAGASRLLRFNALCD